MQGLTDIATGSDAASNRLARQAASASDLGASRQGVLGGARAQRASQTAAADVLAKRQQSALNTLTSTGQGLLGQGTNAYNLAQAPGATLSRAGAVEQQQRQNELNAEAARNQALVDADLRRPTTAERIGQVAGAVEAIPTAYQQARQGFEEVGNLFGPARAAVQPTGYAAGGPVYDDSLLKVFRS